MHIKVIFTYDLLEAVGNLWFKLLFTVEWIYMHMAVWLISTAKPTVEFNYQYETKRHIAVITFTHTEKLQNITDQE
jgi:hypothetical protein